MAGTFLAPLSRVLWRLLEHHSMSPEPIFREAGMDPALMDEPRGRYRVDSAMSAWAKAGALIEDPCFALKAEHFWHPPDLHALGYAFLASSTLRTALDRLVRYSAVVNDSVRYSVDEEGERVICAHRYVGAELAMPVAVEDARWAFFISICRLSCGENLNPVEVWFQRPEPPCAGDYYGLFRSPISFGAEISAIVFARADVYRPLPATNRELARANDKILAAYLKELTEGDLISRVKRAITNELPSGSPSEEVIAKSLFMSPRTLQRKLSNEGTSYSILLDAVRRELAEQYVTDPSLSLSEIGFLLGFSEQSAFSRAFRRWTGQAPSAARASLSA
jgi:AraC-like DNA-binding protein